MSTQNSKMINSHGFLVLLMDDDISSRFKGAIFWQIN